VIERALGLSVLPLNPTIARQLGASESTQGLVVSVVDPSSDAGTKGLQRGDIVLTANYKPVSSVADLEAAVREAKAANRVAVLLRVQRRGQPATYLPVRTR
jgi:serine protease Do